MFDSLRKKLKKTIKDASDSIPEEELEPSQISKELDDLEADLQSIEEKYSDNTDEEEDTEEVSTTENVVEEENIEEESSEDETEEEVKTPDEVEEETIEESQEEPEELVEDETDEEIVEESADEVQEEAPEEKKKGFFGFLKRDKNKKEEHTFETEEIVEEETIEESEEVVEEKVPETEKTEEESSEEVQEKSKEEEDKGRFGFLRRDKKKETSDEKEDVKDSKKEEKAVKYEDEETGGKFSFITKKTIKEEDIEEILEELEFSLIEGDVAFDVAERIVESVKEDLVGRKINGKGIYIRHLCHIGSSTDILLVETVYNRPLPLYSDINHIRLVQYLINLVLIRKCLGMENLHLYPAVAVHYHRIIIIYN